MTSLAFFLWLIAGDYPDSPLRDWYRSLKQPGTGVSCCDISDCRPVEARTAGDHWQALIGDRWLDVPPEKVLKARDNPTGSAVACYIQGTQDVYWFCFLPSSMV